MSVRRLQLVALCCASLAACDSRKPLPPPPVFAPGQSYAAGANGSASAGLIADCRRHVHPGSAATLAAATDLQIVTELCRTLADRDAVAGRGDDPQQICVAATNSLEKEFVRRFPRHDPKEANGRC